VTHKLYDVAVKTREYQDRQTGQTKGVWKNVGAVMQGDDGNQFIVLDRTFNPAGVPNPDNRDNLLLSCFVPQDQREQGGQQRPATGRPAATSAPTGQRAAPAPQRQAPPPDNFDDDVPF